MVNHQGACKRLPRPISFRVLKNAAAASVEMGRGSAGSVEVCNSAACATLLRWLKTELVEDEDMGGGKEEPAEAGKKRKRKR